MNPDLDRLLPYPFERLTKLKHGVTPPANLSHIPLSIGEPKHAPPTLVVDALRNELAGLAAYPVAKGLPELRETIARWLTQRFGLNTGRLDPERQVIPVNGTREGLFAFVQAIVDRNSKPLVMMPNPFYQIYEGAAFLAGAEPWFMDTTEDTGFLPDLDSVPEEVWKRCQLLFICTPGNPTGAVMDIPYLQRVIELADRYDFIIASDECYSEIYLDEHNPPPGLLQACKLAGRHDFRRCVVFHSLSKRSNVPGLRSGFVAGDAQIMDRFLLYRTYHGCAVPNHVQLASVLAWNDEQHVADNRALYRQKFKTAMEILEPVMDVSCPPAAFYLWPRTPIDDEDFARGLFAHQNVTVVPGSYLSRSSQNGNPGKQRIRISLVAPVEECHEAMQRLRSYVESL